MIPTERMRGDGEYVRHRRIQRKNFAARHRRLNLWFLAVPFAALGLILMGLPLAMSLPREFAYSAYVSMVIGAGVLYLGTLTYRGWLRWKEDWVLIDLVTPLAAAPILPFIALGLIWMAEPSGLPAYAVGIFEVFPWVFVACAFGTVLVAAYMDYRRYLRSTLPSGRQAP